MKQSYDVIIVGAGPAGCTTAGTLAMHGYEILLVDRAIFPRDKVCGDGLGSGGLDVLERLDMLGKIEEIRPFKATTVTLSSPAGVVMSSGVPSVKGSRDYGYVIPRKTLDNILVEHVKGLSNVTVAEGFTVTDFLKNSGRIVGIKGRQGQDSREFIAPFVVGADGAHSVVAKKLGLINKSTWHRTFAVRAYFDNVNDLGSGIELHFDQSVLPGYGWLFPMGDGKANVGVGIGNQFVGQKKIKELFEIFVSKNEFVKDRLKNATMRENTFRGWPLHNGCFRSTRYFRNVLLVGDAGSFVDPLSGEGIYFALKSGEFAGQAIHKAVKTSCQAEVGRIFERLWKKEFLWKEFIPGFVAQYFMSKRFFANMAIGRAARDPKKAEIFCGAMSHNFPKARLLANI